MTNHNFHPYGQEARIFDLQNGFGDVDLSDQGELEISPFFDHDIFAQLGGNSGDTVRISQIPIPQGEDYALNRSPSNQLQSTDPHNLYTIENTRNGGSTLLADSLTPANNPLLAKMGYTNGMTSTILDIGRETTPNLKLSDAVSRLHMSIRIGALAGRIHFMNLDSLNSTLVALHPDDARMVSPPSKYIKTGKYPDFMVNINQEWMR